MEEVRQDVEDLEVGEARVNFHRIVKGMSRLKEISAMISEKVVGYLKELTEVCMEMFRATGSRFEQEHFRFINMVTAAGSDGSVGGSVKYPKSIMENKVIQNVRAINGDKSLFRQWHQKFTTARGQVGVAYQEIVHRLVKEVDFGKTMEKVFAGHRADYGYVFETASGHA